MIESYGQLNESTAKRGNTPAETWRRREIQERHPRLSEAQKAFCSGVLNGLATTESFRCGGTECQ